MNYGMPMNNYNNMGVGQMMPQQQMIRAQPQPPPQMMPQQQMPDEMMMMGQQQMMYAPVQHQYNGIPPQQMHNSYPNMIPNGMMPGPGPGKTKSIFLRLLRFWEQDNWTYQD